MSCSAFDRFLNFQWFKNPSKWVASETWPEASTTEFSTPELASLGPTQIGRDLEASGASTSNFSTSEFASLGPREPPRQISLPLNWRPWGHNLAEIWKPREPPRQFSLPLNELDVCQKLAHVRETLVSTICRHLGV